MAWMVTGNLKGPKGDKGDQGNTGATPNVTVGTVTTGNEGTSAAVTQTGTQANPVLNFTIPRGAQGLQGNTGATGDAGLTWKGAYNASTAYAFRDAVSWNGSTYYAKAATTPGTDPTQTAYWDVMASRGATGAQGTGIAIKGTAANAAALPGTGNSAGDGRVVQDTGHLYIWDGTNWIDSGQFKGDKGDKGDVGNTGAPGIRGDRWYNGTGAPTGANTPGAVIGDQYIDASTGDLYKNV